MTDINASSRPQAQGRNLNWEAYCAAAAMTCQILFHQPTRLWRSLIVVGQVFPNGESPVDLFQHNGLRNMMIKY